MRSHGTVLAWSPPPPFPQLFPRLGKSSCLSLLVTSLPLGSRLRGIERFIAQFDALDEGNEAVAADEDNNPWVQSLEDLRLKRAAKREKFRSFRLAQQKLSIIPTTSPLIELETLPEFDQRRTPARRVKRRVRDDALDEPIKAFWRGHGVTPPSQLTRLVARGRGQAQYRDVARMSAKLASLEEALPLVRWGRCLGRAPNLLGYHQATLVERFTSLGFLLIGHDSEGTSSALSDEAAAAAAAAVAINRQPQLLYYTTATLRQKVAALRDVVAGAAGPNANPAAAAEGPSAVEMCRILRRNPALLLADVRKLPRFLELLRGLQPAADWGKILRRNPMVLTMSFGSMRYQLLLMRETFSPGDAAGADISKVITRAPNLLSLKHSTVQDKLAKLQALLPRASKGTLTAYPTLLYLQPATVAARLAQLQALLPGVDAATVAARHPQLLAMDVKGTLTTKVQLLREHFPGIDPAVLVSRAPAILLLDLKGSGGSSGAANHDRGANSGDDADRDGDGAGGGGGTTALQQKIDLWGRLLPGSDPRALLAAFPPLIGMRVDSSVAPKVRLLRAALALSDVDFVALMATRPILLAYGLERLARCHFLVLLAAEAAAAADEPAQADAAVTATAAIAATLLPASCSVNGGGRSGSGGSGGNGGGGGGGGGKGVSRIGSKPAPAAPGWTAAAQPCSPKVVGPGTAVRMGRATFAARFERASYGNYLRCLIRHHRLEVGTSAPATALTAAESFAETMSARDSTPRPPDRAAFGGRDLLVVRAIAMPGEAAAAADAKRLAPETSAALLEEVAGVVLRAWAAAGGDQSFFCSVRRFSDLDSGL